MTKINAIECQNVEFKRIWKDEYLKWICGFANAQGAVMCFGVDDEGNLCGLQNAKQLLEDIPNKTTTSLGLVVDVDLQEQDGMDYLKVTIPQTNVPVSYKGMFYFAGFIEAWGRGYEIIRDAFEAEHLEVPMFEEVRGGVMATIKREKFIALQNKDKVDGIASTTKKTTKKTTEKTTKKKDSTVDKILQAIQENPQVTNKQLAELLGLSIDGIYWNMKKMRSNGIIRRVGPDKGGYWEILK